MASNDPNLETDKADFLLVPEVSSRQENKKQQKRKATTAVQPSLPTEAGCEPKPEIHTGLEARDSSKSTNPDPKSLITTSSKSPLKQNDYHQKKDKSTWSTQMVVEERGDGLNQETNHYRSPPSSPENDSFLSSSEIMFQFTGDKTDVLVLTGQIDDFQKVLIKRPKLDLSTEREKDTAESYRPKKKFVEWPHKTPPLEAVIKAGLRYIGRLNLFFCVILKKF